MESSEIIKKLLEQGKITEKDIEEVEGAEDKELRQLAIFMHSIICGRNHNSVEQFTLRIEGCNFYAEEQMENPWELQDHIKWHDLALELATSYPQYKENEADLTMLCGAIGIMQKADIYWLVRNMLRKLGMEQ